MPRRIVLIVSVMLLSAAAVLHGQDCNSLGVWLWHLEQTGFQEHGDLAPNLAAMGAKRVYVKVADGRINPDRWTELEDTDLVETYEQEGVEPWAWSYNYPENDSLQGEALYRAAETGYKGFVVDVEMEFDGKPLALFNLFWAFSQARRRAIADGIATDSFPLYITTWGNPQDHSFPIAAIDGLVTGYMPQTYVEVWGQSFMDRITHWINVGNQEYRDLGATKPIHHICATQEGLMTAELIDEFIAASGPETSLWRVPGGGVPLSVWQEWWATDWDADFCEQTTDVSAPAEAHPAFYPNPTSDFLYFSGPLSGTVSVHDLMGRMVLRGSAEHGRLDVSALPDGIYLVRLSSTGLTHRVIKN